MADQSICQREEEMCVCSHDDYMCECEQSSFTIALQLNSCEGIMRSNDLRTVAVRVCMCVLMCMKGHHG